VPDEAVIHITSEEAFKERVITSRHPCVVDFYSERCPPCRMLAPRLEELAEAYRGRVTVCKVSLDDVSMQVLSQRYGIRAVPYVIFFRNGKRETQLVGLHDRADYAAILDDMLGE